MLDIVKQIGLRLYAYKMTFAYIVLWAAVAYSIASIQSDRSARIKAAVATDIRFCQEIENLKGIARKLIIQGHKSALTSQYFKDHPELLDEYEKDYNYQLKLFKAKNCYELPAVKVGKQIAK